MISDCTDIDVHHGTSIYRSTTCGLDPPNTFVTDLWDSVTCETCLFSRPDPMGLDGRRAILEQGRDGPPAKMWRAIHVVR